MCQVKCPVKINTGELIKHIRHENLGDQSRAQKVAMVCPFPFERVYLQMTTHADMASEHFRALGRCART